MDSDRGFSRELTKHLESPSEFERKLFTETVSRIEHIRTLGFVIKPTKWYDWLAPATSAALIITVYYAYIFPKF